MLETMKYVRKQFLIDAVQVTAENINDVASWANGEVRSEPNNVKYVKVRVFSPLKERQTKAYIGDWVLYAGTGFKVYTPKAFSNSFEQQSVETTMHETTPVEEETSTKYIATVEKTAVAPKKAAKRTVAPTAAQLAGN